MTSRNHKRVASKSKGKYSKFNDVFLIVEGSNGGVTKSTKNLGFMNNPALVRNNSNFE